MKIRDLYQKLYLRHEQPIDYSIILIIIIICVVAVVSYQFALFHRTSTIESLTKKSDSLQQQLQKTNDEYFALKNQNQYKINQQLAATNAAMLANYKNSVAAYQNITDLADQKADVGDLEKEYASVVQQLSTGNYSSASATLKDLNSHITTVQNSLVKTTVDSAQQNQNVTTSNTPPGNGYSVQNVQTSSGTFLVEIIAADLSSTKVIVDTASSGDCSNNCPVLPLSDYVSRNGAYAGINGTLFCPQDYPSCAGKVGSFDTLLMNKNKTYFNSSNNVYSTVPAIIIFGTSVRVVSQSLQWGRDTGPDMVFAMQPLLIQGGSIVYSGSSDPKYGSKGPRGFIANKGSTVFIGFVMGANMSDSANVLHTMGMDNAINTDEGGSTALMFNGSYKAGPGRNIPNAVLFVRK